MCCLRKYKLVQALQESIWQYLLNIIREGNGNPLQYSCLENPMESLRVGNDRATSLSVFTFMYWRRKWQPTPVFLPGESQGRGSLVGCRLWGHTELDTTEATQQQQQSHQGHQAPQASNTTTNSGLQAWKTQSQPKLYPGPGSSLEPVCSLHSAPLSHH